MFAVVEIGGIQFEVQPNDILKVPYLEGNPGDTVQFDKILLTSDDVSTKLETDELSGSVSAKILEHGKGEKVIVFKKKRRKGYRKLNGHRQMFTKIEIAAVNLK